MRSSSGLTLDFLSGIFEMNLRNFFAELKWSVTYS